MQNVTTFSDVSVKRVPIIATGRETTDVLAVEEPLEIRLGFPDGTHTAISITMRTPGHDAELAAGFLFTEGILRFAEQIKQIRHCGLKIKKVTNTIDRAAALNSNTIRVDLADGVDIDLDRLKRNFYTTSSCGVCGKSSIDALKTEIASRPNPNGLSIDSAVLRALPDRLRAAQDAFEQTGGLHASALFDENGNLDIIREDVGRHNALDKVIGAKVLDGRSRMHEQILLVSGRASFELVQKALMAGIPVMAAVGAPSSLAVELAEEYGMTLVGFLRADKFNIYSGSSRVKS